jgi:glycosyltransferase involved in cell wall biosynthesis
MLEGLVLGVAALACAMWISRVVALARMARLPILTDVEPELPAGRPWPTVSVVVACRDEAAGVEQATISLLRQDYPALELVAVDDRSTDGTGQILDRLAGADGRLRVVHVRDLPAGWLGKTHALQRGAEIATGAWILFTDADVVFSPDALRRAMAWAVAEDAGHAVAMPHFVAPGFLERCFVAVFGVFFLVDRRPDRLDRPRSRAYIGVGGFNLVRTDAYRAIGGHQALRLEVVDDVKLGLLLRRQGVRQRCADSGNLVRVRWQRGFVASMRGLVKNFFAGLEFRYGMVALTALGVPMLTTFPLAYLLLGGQPWMRVLAAIAWVLPTYATGQTARRLAGGTGFEGLALPFAGLCLGAVSLASAAAVTLRGAVVWRGTRYPLSELRAGCVREADWPRDRAVG